MLRISWIEHTTNEEVYRKVGESKVFLKTKTFLIGHILQLNSVINRIIEGDIERTIYRGDRHWTTLIKYKKYGLQIVLRSKKESGETTGVENSCQPGLSLLTEQRL